jgi:TPR repeat protein
MKKINLFICSLTLLMGVDTHYELCKGGDAKACFKAAKEISLMQIKSTSSSSIENTASKAAQLYKKSCELGYIEGCTAYGMHFYADTAKDPQKDDLYYFKKACDGGDQVGCTLLKMAPNYKKKHH